METKEYTGKLPGWANQKILRLERDLKEAREKLAQMDGGETNVKGDRMNPQKRYAIYRKLPQLGLNESDWQLVQQVKAQGYEWSDWLRSAIRLLAAVEAAGLTGEDVIKQIEKKASK